jgi:hypothetical protein
LAALGATDPGAAWWEEFGQTVFDVLGEGAKLFQQIDPRVLRTKIWATMVPPPGLHDPAGTDQETDEEQIDIPSLGWQGGIEWARCEEQAHDKVRHGTRSHESRPDNIAKHLDRRVT